jgi:hypothetical protein
MAILSDLDIVSSHLGETFPNDIPNKGFIIDDQYLHGLSIYLLFAVF